MELAYAACLLDEQHGWQTPDELEGVALSVYNNGQQISDLELSVMAEQLAQQLTSPQDPAAAATATLQASAIRCKYHLQDAIHTILGRLPVTRQTVTSDL